MMCLANRIETLQGDPRISIKEADSRKRVISYGNRLFCDVFGDELRYRWGSAKLYRAYFQDYRAFLQRPELVADQACKTGCTRIVVIHSDLSQFYDRVRPELLHKKLETHMKQDDDPHFFTLARRIFDWRWHYKDSREVSGYAEQAELSDFSRVALPQGLVASGFFANLVLLDFDEALRADFSKEIETGIVLEDFCRYVDDLRIVLKIAPDMSLLEAEQKVTHWLQNKLDEYANGLPVKPEKTKAALLRGDERPLVRQSRKMRAIQSTVSGGFDAIGGIDILDAIQGLIRSQERYSEQRTDSQGWSFAPIPDVRDETVARFAAARYRITYRSLRPLLAEGRELSLDEPSTTEDGSYGRSRVLRTKSELDDDVRAFALGLIENWVKDPSNVRLLRIGLDLWPAEEVLKKVLELLRPFTEKGGRRKAPRRVAWYCLSEIFRAGAIETGFVEDDESMPDNVDIKAYRNTLWHEALRLAALPSATLPWYLRQQVLLFLAVNNANQAPILRTGINPETRNYRKLIRFIKGEENGLKSSDYATFSVLARRSFCEQLKGVHLARKGITVTRLEQIAERDPSFALEILDVESELGKAVSPRVRNDLCLSFIPEDSDWISLSTTVLREGSKNPIRNEITLLSFAMRFLESWGLDMPEVITPSEIKLKLNRNGDVTLGVDQVQINASRVSPESSIYRPPTWCPSEERWRFNLGYLLRFILTAKQDFTRIVRQLSWKEKATAHRPPETHWYQRLYGLFSGHSAFGDDWLPISEWTENLLLKLLSWPGCRSTEAEEPNIQKLIFKINFRLKGLLKRQGRSSRVLMLPMNVPRIAASPSCKSLRLCIAQTVIPCVEDIKPSDLTMSDRNCRRRHRNHLSAALAAIERMLALRETHKGREGRLDWLILPELSVHPSDVRTHLVPFARAHRTIILAGLTYQELFPGNPLVNSALWVIPVWSKSRGLQIRTFRQGKQHLAPQEQALNSPSNKVIQGFRPCQWLIGYEWLGCPESQPLWLTASICYDATDISLATDLRDESDVFAILALNKDVTTFDQMALALHYHMFQLVIVANNGSFGGSNAYAPYREDYHRQVLHLHGQPQATVAFLEIDDIAAFLRRRTDAISQSSPAPNPNGSITWKFPPAG